MCHYRHPDYDHEHHQAVKEMKDAAHMDGRLKTTDNSNVFILSSDVAV